VPLDVCSKGRTRRGGYYLPGSITNVDRPQPVMLALHGSDSTGEEFLGQLKALAQKHKVRRNQSWLPHCVEAAAGQARAGQGRPGQVRAR